MTAISLLLMYFQAVCTVVALLLNTLLIYVVKTNCKSGIGAYKYVLINFAIFEMVYAVVVAVGMPVNYIVQKSWLVFNYDGLIGHTSFNWIGPALYCTFYQVWMGLVIVHFIYRYIIVCRIEWRQKIESGIRWKVILAVVYAAHVAYAFLCGFYYCTRITVSNKMLNGVHENFGIEDPETIGYIVVRMKTHKGEVSPTGAIATFNHYFIVSISLIIIPLCSVKIWCTIRRLERGSCLWKEVSLQRQMFITLLIQVVNRLVLLNPFLIRHKLKWSIDFILYLTLGPVSMFLYAVIIITMIRHWKVFKGSYYKLFLVSAAINTVTYFVSFPVLQLPNVVCRNCSLSSFYQKPFLGTDTMRFLTRYAFQCNIFLDGIMVINRYFAIKYPFSYNETWNKLFLPVMCVTLAVPALLNLPSYFNPSYPEYLPEFDRYAYTFTEDSPAATVYIPAATLLMFTVCVIIFTGLTFYVLSQRSRRSTRSAETKLFAHSCVNAALSLIGGIYQTIRAVSPTVDDTVNSNRVIADYIFILTCAAPYILLIFSRDIRKHMPVLSRFEKKRKTTPKSKQITNHS